MENTPYIGENERTATLIGEAKVVLLIRPV